MAFGFSAGPGPISQWARGLALQAPNGLQLARQAGAAAGGFVAPSGPGAPSDAPAGGMNLPQRSQMPQGQPWDAGGVNLPQRSGIPTATPYDSGGVNIAGFPAGGSGGSDSSLLSAITGGSGGDIASLLTSIFGG